MRGLGNVFKGAVFFAGLVGVSGSAFAQADPEVLVTVTPINGEVTLSRPASKQGANDELPTYAAYRIEYKNSSTSTLGRLYFQATLTTLDTFGLPLASSAASFQGPNIPDTFACSGYGTATIDCKSGITLAPAGSSGDTYSVVVVAKTPMAGAELQINVYAGGHEGKGQGSGCCGQNADPVKTTLIDATTNTSYRRNAQSFIRGSGGALFTGDQWITISGTDDYTTKVSIPPFTSAGYEPNGQITEEPADNLNCSTGGRFTTCYKSGLSFPNVQVTPIPTADACLAENEDKLLTIWVRIDSSLFKSKSLDVNTVRFYYTDSEGQSEVFPCNATTQYPCTCEKKKYTNKSVAGWTKQLDNDLEVKFKHYRNGLLQFF